MKVHWRVISSIKFSGTLLYTWTERGTMRVKCLAQEHYECPHSGLDAGSFDPETSGENHEATIRTVDL